MIVSRYTNIDYAIASTLANDIKAGISNVVVTYDIGCQWAKNFQRRFSTYPSTKFLKMDSLSLCVAVPKFHIIGHGALCQANYNLAYMDGVGMTHGEAAAAAQNL